MRHIKAIPIDEWKSDREIIAELREELSQVKAERDRLKSANLELLSALGFSSKTGHHPIPKED